MYQLDQSIKIENTSQATYVAIANGTCLTCAILAKDKRILKHLFRQLGKPLVYKLFTFSFLCSQVIAKTKPHHVVIDQEYRGHEIDIKNYITQLLTIAKQRVPNLVFKSIGKESPAHHRAYHAYKIRKADFRVPYQEVIKKYEQIDR